MLVKLILFCFVIFATQEHTSTSEIALDNDEVFTLECKYDISCRENLVIKATKGYLLRIIVKSVDIDGENGDFLLIKSGTELNDGLTGRIFMYHIDSERVYISLTNTVLIHFNVNGSKYVNTGYEGFVLTAQRIGARSLPNAEQTTEAVPHNVSRHLTVSMTIIDNNLDVAIPIFCETVAVMALDFTKYLDRFGSNLIISPEHVNITRITRCPINWPHQKTCYKITFMLPISMSDDAYYYGEYQLSQDYLRQMWANASYYFPGPMIFIYELSEHSHYFIVWISVICGVVVVFGISYLIIGHICSQKIRRKRANIQKEEDNTFDINQRSSVFVFEPRSLHGLPSSQFQNDMTFYEPDRAPHLGRVSGLGDPFDDNILDRTNMRYFDSQRIGSQQHTTSNI